MAVYALCKIVSEGLPGITDGCNTADSVGEVFQACNENVFLVQAVTHEISRACDPQSGQPTSSALHKTFEVIKMVDKSTPMLYQALIDPVALGTVEFTWRRNGPTGVEEYFRTTLTDCYVASITAIKKNTLDVSAEGVDYDVPDMERVTFSYKALKLEHLKSGTDYEWAWNDG